MKNKKLILLFVVSLTIIFSMLIRLNQVQAENISAPYYTYTTDSNGYLIKTMEAYTPGEQIYEINGNSFELLQHLYVDSHDYIYITDSKAITKVEQIDPETGEVIINPTTGKPAPKTFIGKIIVLDPNFEFVAEIYHEDFVFPNSTYVTDDKIYVVDKSTQNILIFNKEVLLNHQTIQLDKVIEPPTHPIFQDRYNDEGEKVVDGYTYLPQHIVVDTRGNIYVQGIDSKNGLIMLDDEGSFMTFFGGNPLRIPIGDRIRSFFLSEEQEDKMYRKEGKKIIHDEPSNIAIDKKGYIYTVTATIPTNPIKKFNVSGRNYFKKDMIGTIDMNSIWVGQYNNVFAVNDEGYIFEYDTNGNLLFLFGGNGNRVGLLKKPVSIATNSNDTLIVADQDNRLIQLYTPTKFTNTIHEAFHAYYIEGDYETSREKWDYILQYNAMFDYAHIGLAEAYMRHEEYDKAYESYYYANDYIGMSDAYWGIRQEWMKDNLNYVFFAILLLLIVRVSHVFLKRRFKYAEVVKENINKVRKKNFLIDELLYIFYFLKHPFDGFHEIKREKRVSVSTSTIIYILLGVLVALNYRFTNVVFIPKVGLNITYELLVLAFIVILWVVSNYLVCSINDGEGSIKNVYNATAYALSPILIILPIIIITSHFLTLQEYIFYQFGYLVITTYTLFLMFFMIKDIHNYSVRKTFSIIFKSLFTMLIIGLFLFVVNALGNQMVTVIKEIIVEVINR